MKKCQHCHQPHSKQATFCGYCGLNLKYDSCNACKKTFDPALNYCVHCGAKSGQLQIDKLQNNNRTKGSDDIIYTLILAQTDSNAEHRKSLDKILKVQSE